MATLLPYLFWLLLPVGIGPELVLDVEPASTGHPSHSAPSPDEREQLFANARRYLPNRAQQEALIHELKGQEKHYDAKLHLVEYDIPATANHYHSKLIDTTAHPFRGSASYAADLMDSGVPEYQQRAFRIFEAVIAGQDQQPEHDTYGIWPYHWEEPLTQMGKPDWNWADFIGVSLLETYLKHHEDLPEELRESMKESLIHASRSIRKRDVKPGYTNIAIMGTLVTYLTSHLFDLPDMQEYADMRLRRFYDYTVALGGFAEYNSPNYTQVALDELCRMRQYILDPEAKQLVDYCYELGWEVLASHFHPPSAQLGGPHSRSYNTLLKPKFYHFLYAGSQGAIDYQQAQLPVQYYKLQHEIPESLVDQFLTLPQARVEIDTFSVGENPVVGYTYLHPRYCLGTANRSTTWQQRRPLVAYWGTPEEPRYLQPKLLHDGVEFAAGNIFSTQDKNGALTTLDLATDGGDYHISIDRLPDGVFRAKDLRLRFELGGPGLFDFDQLSINDQTIRFRDDDVRLDIQLLHAIFGDQLVDRLEKGRDGKHCWVDLVIYAGKKKKFDLKQLPQATFSWSTRIYTEEEEAALPEAQVRVEDQRVNLRWDQMHLSAPIQPGTEEQLQRSFSSGPETGSRPR